MTNKSIKSAIFKPPYVSQEAYETELLEMEQAGFPKAAIEVGKSAYVSPHSLSEDEKKVISPSNFMRSDEKIELREWLRKNDRNMKRGRTNE